MSQITQFRSLNSPIETMTGNDATKVSPVAGNINLIGDGLSVIVTGDVILGTLTISTPLYANEYDTDDGQYAIPALGILEVFGGSNIHTTSPVLGNNLIRIHLKDDVSIPGYFTASGALTIGTTVEFLSFTYGVLESDNLGNITSTLLTDHALYVGDSDGNLNALPLGVAGEVLTGTAGDPAWSATPTVTTIYATTFDTNVAAAAVTLSGISLIADGTDADIDINITPKGTGVLVTTELNLTTPLEVQYGGSGTNSLTDNGVLYGNLTSPIGATAEGATGTVLVGSTNFPPNFSANPLVTSLTATTVYGTTFDTNVAAAGATLAANELAVDGTDTNIDLILTSKGAGHILFTGYGEGVLGADATGVIYSDAATQYALQVGDATSTLDSLGVGATNEALLGNTGANPSWGTVGNATLTNSSVTLSDGNNITVTGSPLSLGGTATIALSGTTDHTLQSGNATGSLTSLAVGVTGEILIGNSAADASWSSTPTVTTMKATTFDTNVAAAAVTLSGNSLTADGTDANIDINITAKGTGQVVIDDLSLGVVLGVPDGGMGANSHTSHGLLLGDGANDIVSLAEATNGQIPIGSTGNPPTLATISEGTNIDVTNAAGSITLETTKVEINAQTNTTYTLVLGDRGKMVTMTNAAASTFTVPPNSSVAFATGTVITVSQLGAGQVTLTQGSGVTINSVDSNKKIKDQYAAIALHKISTDSWLAVGSLEA